MKKILALIITIALLCSVSASAYAAAELQTHLTDIAPSGMTVLEDDIYIADSYNRAIWSVKDGESQLLAGRAEPKDRFGRAFAGYNDAELDKAAFTSPWDLVPYMEGLLISDTENHVLRYLNLEEETVETISGNGKPAYRDGGRGYVAYNRPTGLALGNDGTVYIADTGNNLIRAMDEEGRVSTYVGSVEGCSLGQLREARLSSPTGLCFYDDVLYIADTGNHRIVAVKDNELVLVAGASLDGDAAIEGGYQDGAADQALFSRPQDIAIADDGSIYVSDTGNGAIRLIKDGQVSTPYSMDSGSYPVSPAGLLIADGSLYIGDAFSRCLLK